MTPEARGRAIAQLLAATEKTPHAERQSIPWKGGSERCTVIELDLDVVVLNHRSHRIRAQLDSHPKTDRVASDPFSDSSQEVIAALLRATPGFDDIKGSLEEEGQLDPGVVTRAGVLVNANTRAVALRDLGQKYIKAMVLPDGATESEISELELRLQVRRDLKQQYSFTNELLFIDECYSSGWPFKRISKELGYTSAEGEKKGIAQVEHQLRMLATIREIREMSNGRLAYDTFDEMRQAMIELDEAHQKLKKRDPGAAEDLRRARIIGVLTGMGYRDLRHVDEDFIDSYLVPELDDSPALKPYLHEFMSTNDRPQGQDLLGDHEDSHGLGEGLLSWLTSTAGHANVTIRSSNVSEPRAEVVEELRDVMGSAAEAARADRSREDLIERPAKRLKEARQKVQAARDSLKQASGDARLGDQVGRIEYEVAKLARDVEALKESVEQIPNPRGR